MDTVAHSKKDGPLCLARRGRSCPDGPLLAAFASQRSTKADDTAPRVGLGRLPSSVSALPIPSPTACWDVLKDVDADVQSRLCAVDRDKISSTVKGLQQYVEKNNLNFVPVFGYWSLRTDNYREFGRRHQKEVQPLRDTVEAHLDGYRMDYVASTLFRGSAVHPGVVASIAPVKCQREGSAAEGGRLPDGEERGDAGVPGTLLKLPLEQAERLLGELFARELLAEADLGPRHAQDGARLSNLMYQPTLQPVVIEGGCRVKALVFETNPDGAKTIASVFDDEHGLTPKRLAYFMAAQGGFELGGQRRGGPALDYWRAGVERLQVLGEQAPAMVRQAMAHLARASESESSMLSEMAGMAVPRATWHEQRDRLARAEARLSDVYTALSSPVAAERHRSHQHAVADAISALRASEEGRHWVVSGGDFRRLVSQRFVELLERASIKADVYEAPDGDGRYLLYSDSGPGTSFCLQVLARRSGRRSPASGVLSQGGASRRAGGLLSLWSRRAPSHARGSGSGLGVFPGAKNVRAAAPPPSERDVSLCLDSGIRGLAVSVQLCFDTDGISGAGQRAALQSGSGQMG